LDTRNDDDGGRQIRRAQHAVGICIGTRALGPLEQGFERGNNVCGLQEPVAVCVTWNSLPTDVLWERQNQHEHRNRHEAKALKTQRVHRIRPCMQGVLPNFNVVIRQLSFLWGIHFDDNLYGRAHVAARIAQSYGQENRFALWKCFVGRDL
jgi:hypothetical protein